MKRTLSTTINRSKSEKNYEHYTELAVTNTFTHNALNQMVGRGVLDTPPTAIFAYSPDGGIP